MIRPLLHYGIHFLVPILIAFLFFPKIQWKAALILLLGIIIDADHLLAEPIFDSERCSIGFHPLHSYFAITLYLLLLAIPKLRLIALALCIHIIADAADCILMRFGF